MRAHIRELHKRIQDYNATGEGFYDLVLLTEREEPPKI